MRNWSSRLALFVGVLALVVLGAGVLGFVAADTPADPADATVDNEYYTSQEILDEAELASRSGEIEIRSGPPRTVLVASDRPRREIEPVVTALVANGHEVRFFDEGTGRVALGGIAVVGGVSRSPPSQQADAGKLSTELESVDAFLVVGDPQFESSDVDAVEDFVDAGGRLLVATDSEASTPFGFASPDGGAESLLDRFGIAVGDGYLYNMTDNDANFQRVYAAGDFDGGSHRVVLDGATPVWTSDGTPLASATEAQYSATREADEFDVAVRSGNVVVLGDTDVVRSMNYNRADNDRLLSQALTVLTSGPPEPYRGSETEPRDVSIPPGAEHPTKTAGDDVSESGR